MHSLQIHTIANFDTHRVPHLICSGSNLPTQAPPEGAGSIHKSIAKSGSGLHMHTTPKAKGKRLYVIPRQTFSFSFNFSGTFPRNVTLKLHLAQKRLFVQDYHDIFLPYIGRINAQKKGSMYATRKVLFLKSEKILTPLAIELTVPSSSAGSKKKSRVFTPPAADSIEQWVWKLAKAHVASVDMSYHEVVSHL